jgi:hypothetical protein
MKKSIVTVQPVKCMVFMYAYAQIKINKLFFLLVLNPFLVMMNDEWFPKRCSHLLLGGLLIMDIYNIDEDSCAMGADGRKIDTYDSIYIHVDSPHRRPHRIRN